MDAQLRRALLECSVLATLQAGDSYGYRIVHAVSPHIPITESTLYPILRRLETAGCLQVYTEEHNHRLRRYYTITETGRARVRDFLAEWEQAMAVCAYIRSTAKNDSTNEGSTPS